MGVPAQVHRLVEQFDANLDDYKNGYFSEAQVRIDFIDPLLKDALGWDVHNEKGLSETYREVVYEDRVKVGGGTKAPDYGFYVGGQRKFFLEAKKPSVDIAGDVAPAVQLRRYAWSAKLPLSILTDFEELAIYDCRYEPYKADRATTARLDFITYDKYVDRWDDIYSVFSREAVLSGSLDKVAEKTKRKRGTFTVDDAFLKEIEGWREALARDLAFQNNLNRRRLNYAVQMTIDRIIFLRMAEDRGIEQYGRLLSLANSEHVYARLCELFREADDRYNSGLFHFRKEKGRFEDPDSLTLTLKIDDELLRKIIGGLYYPESPYEFSVLPVDVLGQVYEQFLGKVIRLEDGKRAVVEEKPEVRKAGGVYYTPTYIVEYIVEHTVGKLLQGKRPGPRGGASKLKIVDPACGSGSFLVGAYQYVLDWHRDRYIEDGPEKHPKELYQGLGGRWMLTIDEKKRILLNNIYGVDIDAQAVEVTKLSLLLKVLEGESEQTLETQLRMFQERVLPDLDNNIKWGNTLIGPDFYEEEQMTLLDEEEHYRINVFDWEATFPQVFTGDNPGFDAVIGNPPYIRIQALKEFAPVEVEHYKKAFRSAGKGNYDIYVVFVERGLSLLNKNGRLGYILPHKFFNAKYGAPVRELIAEGKHLSEIVHFGDEQVFTGAATYTALMFLDKTGSNHFRFVKADDLLAWRTNGETVEGVVPTTSVTASDWTFVVGKGAALFEKLRQMPVKLADISEKIFQGLITGADSVFILTDSEDGRYYSESTGGRHNIEADLMHPLCKGSVNLRRYRVEELTKSILFPYKLGNGGAKLLSQEELETQYPGAWEYLQANRTVLESRERGKWRHEQWYAFGRSQNLSAMEQKKLLTPSIANYASFTLDTNDFYYFVGSGGGGGGGYGVTIKADQRIAYEYVLGLLNSKLLDNYLKSYSSRFRGGYYAYNRQYIEQLPIRIVDFADPKDMARHDRMVALVERMLALHEKLAAAKIGQEKAIMQRQIEATDRQIDQLVYELYGLTEEEIAVVEKALQ